MSNNRIAVVRSGGGVDGLDIHAGIWLALAEHLQDRTVSLFGTSAGAVATAAHGFGWSPQRYAAEIRLLKDEDVRDARFAWPVRVMWVPSIWEGEKIKSLLARLFPVTWEQYNQRNHCNAHVYATRISDAACIDMMSPMVSGQPRDAIYASLAIPCVLPPYRHNGAAYRDGGIRRNLPLPPDWREYDHVYLCIAAGKRNTYADKDDVVSQGLTLFEQFLADSILDVLDETRDATNVTIIWPEPDSRGSMLRFDHDLISKACEHADLVLSGCTRQTDVLAAGLVAMSNNANWGP